MPIRVEWGNPEKTILLETMAGNWTVMDINIMLAEVKAMMTEVPHRVDIIADLTDANFTFDNLLPLVNRTQHSRPLNGGTVVGVNVPRSLKAVIALAARFSPKVAEDIRFVDSLEEAYALLRNRVMPPAQASS